MQINVDNRRPDVRFTIWLEKSASFRARRIPRPFETFRSSDAVFRASHARRTTYTNPWIVTDTPVYVHTSTHLMAHGRHAHAYKKGYQGISVRAAFYRVSGWLVKGSTRDENLSLISCDNRKLELPRWPRRRVTARSLLNRRGHALSVVQRKSGSSLSSSSDWRNFYLDVKS